MLERILVAVTIAVMVVGIGYNVYKDYTFTYSYNGYTMSDEIEKIKKEGDDFVRYMYLISESQK